MPKILGISAFYHDSAAAIVVDGIVIAAAQEERFSRIKHSAAFPSQAIQYCLKEAGLELKDLDAVVFYDKPFLKFERLLETYYAFAPKGFISFLKAIPAWFNDKLFLRKNILKGLQNIGEFDKNKLPVLFTEHHLSHAASTFFVSPFEEAAILTIDGVGEWCTASIGHGKNNTITLLREMHFPHSVGLLYSAFTYYLGFTVNSGEYKVMGLAPYGDLEAEQTQDFITIIKEYLIDIKQDGSIFINQNFFKYATGLRMTDDKKWASVFGIQRRKPEDALTAAHCNLALALQIVTEEIVLKMAAETQRITGSKNICLAGGVALNCVANGKLLKSGLYENIYVQPASGDAGGALGAALAAEYLYYKKNRNIATPDAMKGSYLGPEFNSTEIENSLQNFEAVFEKYTDATALNEKIAAPIAEGKIAGLFRGRMEFGPRALGNRSIVANPGIGDMQQKLNLKIKFREGFRPFAPAVSAENCSQYFDLNTPAPYMTLVANLHDKWRYTLPENYNQLNVTEKLYALRSQFPAITHLDYSARVQTVHAETNPEFHHLLKCVKKTTGHPLLVNTSFNVRGEPIVCTPEDAYRCFMATDMDILVIENYLLIKENQPDYLNKSRWNREFKAD